MPSESARPSEGTTSQVSAACHADLTLRDDQHIFALCRKPKDHTDAHHDDELGVTWTDEHYA